MKTKNYEVWDYMRISRQVSPKFDPRIAIARHLDWRADYSPNVTTWTLPEPNNYNHAVRSARPLDCEFIRDAVYYKTDTGSWWSVYFIPDELIKDFHLWLEQQTIEVYWFNSKPTKLKTRKTLLHVAKNAAELTDNERLFTMGYYSEFGAKYFCDDDTILLSHLGTARADILEVCEVIEHRASADIF